LFCPAGVAALAGLFFMLPYPEPQILVCFIKEENNEKY